MQNFPFRQGDVLIVPLNDKPNYDKMERTSKKGQPVVLAEGEATGHAHRIMPEKNEDAAALFMKDGQTFLQVTAEEAKLVHEEHDMHLLPAGDYEVVRQREYTPEEIRTVLD